MNAPSPSHITTDPAIRPHELGELLSAFNDATARLQLAHESLHAEVAQLKNDLREANEQLERSRRLAALGEMAAGIAHEVRNPLGSIRLYARMLEQDLASRPEERKLAEKIGSAVRGLDAVVCDVLNFARETPIRATRVSAGALLRGAIDEVLADERLMQPRTGPGVFVATIDPECDTIVVECDEQLTHRALVNVIRNAVEAMLHPEVKAADSRELRAPQLCLGARRTEAGDAISLFVRDTGPGIPPEAMERIFNPFFTTRATGTGLGLAIVHRIVDAHGGRTRVRNLAVEHASQHQQPGAAVAAGGLGAVGGAEVELLFPVARACAAERDRGIEMPRVEVCVGAMAGSQSLQSRVREDDK